MKEIQIEFYRRKIELMTVKAKESTNFAEKEYLYNEIENYKQALQHLTAINNTSYIM